jgi:hypothetical protein
MCSISNHPPLVDIVCCTLFFVIVCLLAGLVDLDDGYDLDDSRSRLTVLAAAS